MVDTWVLQLQQASFRGVPFGVLKADGSFGRRVAIHEYPFRDKPYVEDLGRATRRITILGFLVSNSLIYGGGDVKAQREKMIGAAETKDAGALVHPTLGQLNVSLLNVAITEKWDAEHYFECVFTFVESGERVFPSIATATGDATLAAAGVADAGASADFLSSAVGDLAYGASVVDQVVSTSLKWAAPALALVRDATNLSHLASVLPGTFGRYFGGANIGGLNLLGDTGNLIYSATLSVSSLITDGAAARALVSAAVDDFTSLAAQNAPADYAASAQAVADAVRAACIDPADAVRLLLELAKPLVDDPTFATSPVGAACADIQARCNDLFRRAAAVALARASADYQPSSYDDAVNVRDQVTALLDDESLIAGDNFEDETYSALRALRLAVVRDLTDRGASLATMADFSFASPRPALVLANAIYRDSTRADGLIGQVDPVHPAFMPTQFRALSA